MCDLVGPIIKVIKFIGRPAKKYLNYHRKFNKFVDDFKKAQEDLQARKGDIQQQLQDERRFGKKPKQEVENWFKKVDEKISHARGVQDKVSKGKYLFRSYLGKLVDEETKAMKGVYDEGQFSGSLVVNDPSSLTAKLPTPELEGKSTVAEEIYEYLVGDEVRMIGVCGMGGIGKTTIMKHVYNRLLEETKFRKLIWTTVSQDFDVRRLQKSIASELKEDLSDGEDTTIRAAKLSEMLRKQGRHLLILDDVWSSFSLEDVGILKPTVDNGCKLVLTTRSEEVVRSMGCRKVQVACLSTDEALQLFLSKVGQDMPSNPTLESIMKDIVGECDRLPLAIVTVAGCMRGISDLSRWENALNELRGCIRNIRDVEDKVFGCLKFSYDRLRQKDQDCFLYCALYPEDHEIEKKEIIEYWMEEGLIDEMGTREAMQGSGNSVLQMLEENCLLERVGEEGTRIKMHDVVRDMALHITRNRFLVKAGMQLEELPNVEEGSEDLEKVSLMRNYISTIPQNMKSPKFPKLTTLLLPKNSLKEIPDSFFEHTPSLKILDLSNNPIVNLPNFISNLEKLTALLLHGCDSINNLPSLSKLRALKKLDLGGTSIGKIPQGLEMLVSLRYLNLGFTKYLKEIPNGLLSELCSLQYLAIHPAPTRVEEIMKLSGLKVFEVLFRKLRDLNIIATQRNTLHNYLIWVSHELKLWNSHLSIAYSKQVVFENFDINSGDRIMLPHDIQQLKVLKCKGRSLNDICGLKDSTDLKEFVIEGCDELESLFISKGQLETLEFLRLFYLGNLKGIVGESSVGTFSSLKQIHVYGCGKIKKLFSAKWVLHNLEVIGVGDCDEIEEIIASKEEGMDIVGESSVGTLSSLKKIHVYGCGKIKKLFSAKWVLHNLEVIIVDNCDEMEEIIASEEEGTGIVEESSVGTFSSLKEIHVKGCGKIKKLFSAKWVLHSLEVISVRNCDEMEEIISSEEEGMGIVEESSVGTFSSLKKIHVKGCGKIKKLFSAKWVLHNLEVIKVRNCDEMEEIIASEEEGIVTINYTLPKLRNLELWNLPELKSICSKNGVMHCDSLQFMQIRVCPKLKRIPLYLPLLDLDKGKPSPPPSLKAIYVDSEEWWESLTWDPPNAKNVLLPFLKGIF